MTQPLIPRIDGTLATRIESLDARKVRLLIGRLNSVLRDCDGRSNILERFDELTKLLFLKFVAGTKESGTLARLPFEEEHCYAQRMRLAYRHAVEGNSRLVPPAYASLAASDRAISQCVDALSRASFQGAAGFDINGLAYEEVVKNTFDKTDHQQYFTPPPVVRFMVEIMRSRIGGHVCDPAAGTGGFLVEIAKSRLPFDSLTAFEVDQRLAWVAGMNLLCHGVARPTVRCFEGAGSLLPAAVSPSSFDTIITNPPFGSDLSDVDVLRTYQLGKGYPNRRRGILFLERCHQLLAPEGWLAIVIDEGVLNGSSTQDVREFIRSNFQIDAIVSLPETTFMPYASVHASVLVLRKRRVHNSPAETSMTFFAGVRHVGRKNNGDPDHHYAADGTQSLRSDLPEVAKAHAHYREFGRVDSTALCYVADIEATLATDGGKSRLDFKFHHPARRENKTKLDRIQHRLMPLFEICEDKSRAVVPAAEMPNESVLYTGLADIEALTGVVRRRATPTSSLKSTVRCYAAGDIVFAKMRPELRKAAHMDFAQGGVVSSECMIFTVRQTAGHALLDPLLLSALLRSDFVHDQIMHLVSGIGRPRISPKDLWQVRVPVPDRPTQISLKSWYLAEIAAAAELRANAAALANEAGRKEKAALERVSGGLG